MREIKFRAWDNQKGMTYSGSVSFDGSWQIDAKGGVAVLMQYTGLKDKNGKEVYEGDIIKVQAEGSEWNTDVEIPRIYMMEYEGETIIEVIGNAYETPELIKPS